MIGALSYGELAAAMPHAGGQYVYLRESLGPMWGFLYGWTMLLVIQTATIAAVAIAFAKFTGVMVPWFSATGWIWKAGTMGPWHLWFGTLGPYNVGLNTQNLLAIASDCFLDVAEYARIADRHDRAEYFHGDEDWGAGRAGGAGRDFLHRSGAAGELHGFLAQRGIARACILIRRTRARG